jgi:CRISPR-associated endonuclease/helicase Cas3
MSLDLDADVLITELAPVPALIQRMGRCCRQDPPGKRRGRVYAYAPEGYRVGGPRGTAGRPAPGAAPYTADELDQGAKFVAALAQRDEQGKQREVCQDDLAVLLEELVPEDRTLWRRARSAFPDSGPFALTRDDQFRDENEYVVDAILSGDVEAWLAARAAQPKQPTERLVVPVPLRYTEADERLGSFLRRAEGGRYQRFLGYREEVEPDGPSKG